MCTGDLYPAAQLPGDEPREYHSSVPVGANLQTSRDGVHPGGFGTEYLWYQGVLYVLGQDTAWWAWTGNDWSFFGSDPSS
jgi:hypothetical protein